MKQELLVTRDRWQTRIAVIEDGRLTEFQQEPSHLDGLVGNLYVGKVSRILPGMESAFVSIGLDRDGFLFEGDMGPLKLFDEELSDPSKFRNPTVKNLREGERILVQVTKEPMGPKGARLSTQLSLPGHYMVYMPFLDHVGVSRRISGDERRRLKETVRRYKGGFPGGFIVRTAAEGADEADLGAEMQALTDLWSLVWLKSAHCEAPFLVHQEADLVGRSVREILLKGDGTVLTDDPDVASRCRELLSSLGDNPGRVRTWDDRRVSLFEHYHVQEEIEKALRPRVWLPSGGCIVLQSTEALVAIDVNSGRFTGKRSLEDTAFAINMEAAEEIVRQIRLRSLGGIIVIDFIDMTKKSHREALVAKLNEALKRDRAKSRILAISEFGLVEMTRKRSHRNLERVMTSVCPCCEGRGRVQAPWIIAQRILEAVDALPPPRNVMVTAAQEVIRYIKENDEYLRLPEGVHLEAMALVNPSSFSLKPLRKGER
ncbi:MAG: Rne/Rng family ribonuclease [Acidobacteriota bacterium]